ncbi:MAG: hypothetical protein LUD19_03735, partial [Clostridia bacterium]|nr:hypothetical protein [Clostridia bacterium]
AQSVASLARQDWRPAGWAAEALFKNNNVYNAVKSICNCRCTKAELRREGDFSIPLCSSRNDSPAGLYSS